MIEPKYSPIHFRAEELLPKELYTLLGRGGLNVFEEYALKGLDQLRAYCGFPILVNDWHKGESSITLGLGLLDSSHLFLQFAPLTRWALLLM